MQEALDRAGERIVKTVKIILHSYRVLINCAVHCVFQIQFIK
jgi:hypothetical protein